MKTSPHMHALMMRLNLCAWRAEAPYMYRKLNVGDGNRTYDQPKADKYAGWLYQYTLNQIRHDHLDTLEPDGQHKLKTVNQMLHALTSESKVNLIDGVSKPIYYAGRHVTYATALSETAYAQSGAGS